MNYLVGDIGNTLIKISILNYKLAVIKSYNLNTNKIYIKKNINFFLEKCLNKKLSKKVLFSSVVPKAYIKIEKYLNERNFKTFEIKDLKIKKILKTNIKNFNQLGSDRIVNAIGAKKFKNCLVLDFGTATTFDVIKNEVYKGGVIAPGVKLSIMN